MTVGDPGAPWLAHRSTGSRGRWGMGGPPGQGMNRRESTDVGVRKLSAGVISEHFLGFQADMSTLGPMQPQSGFVLMFCLPARSPARP